MTENNKQEIQENKNKGLRWIWILLIIGIIIIAIAISLDAQKNKVQPYVEVEETLTGLIFNIQCYDNYKYVILEIELYNNDNTKAKTFTLREDNLKKGELRQAEYKFSINEYFTANYVKVKVKELK